MSPRKSGLVTGHPVLAHSAVETGLDDHLVSKEFNLLDTTSPGNRMKWTTTQAKTHLVRTTT